MTTLDTPSTGPVPDDGSPHLDQTDAAQWAKAYCGPAHGHTWRRQEPGSWPPRIVLPSPTGPLEYRLVRDLRAHRPARDRLGNTLYMPVPPHQPTSGRW